MSAHVSGVRDELRFRGVCSCGWSGYPMEFREDAKLEAMMHADLATLRATTLNPESAPTHTSPERGEGDDVSGAIGRPGSKSARAMEATRAVGTPETTKEEEALHDAFEALDECVDDLEAELGNRYERPGYDVHPAIQPKYDRDMAVVKGARDALWILRARALTQPMSTSAPEVIEPVDLDAIVDIASEGWRVLNGDRPAPGVGIMGEALEAFERMAKALIRDSSPMTRGDIEADAATVRAALTHSRECAASDARRSAPMSRAEIDRLDRLHNDRHPGYPVGGAA